MTTVIFFAASYLVVVLFYKNAHYLALVLHSKEERDALHQYLTKRFAYYNLLSSKNQLKFIYRMMVIRKTNQIKVDAEISHVNHDIEFMVSAAFTQITFGFTQFELKRFSKIIIYPDSFYSKMVGSHVNGLTVGNGYIHLSWNHFLKGYQNNDDKINLALHELAHALYIDKFHFEGTIKWFTWELEAIKVFEQIKNDSNHNFFRAYAKTNMAEFWAVSIECFFEDPVNFKKQFPILYNATSSLLKQDLLSLN